MTWIGEIMKVVAQGFWEGAVEAAYNRWGWIGGAATLVAPFTAGGFALWIFLK